VVGYHGWGIPPVFSFLWVVERPPSALRAGLGLLVSDFLFTYVCMNLPQERERLFVAPPTVHPLRVGRRSQFVFSRHLVW